MVTKKALRLTVPFLVLTLLMCMIVNSCSEPEPTTSQPTTSQPTTTQPAEQATYEWRLASPMTEGSLGYQAAEKFIEMVAEASDGRMVITHYPGTLLGDYSAQQEAVSAGGLEMALTWPLSSLDPRWAIIYIGYATFNYDQALEAWGPGGWAMTTMDQEVASDSNWKVLSVLYNDFCGWSSTKPFDPMPNSESIKDIKIRTAAVKGNELRLPAFGFQVVTMPWAEVHSSLLLGTIDATAGQTADEAYNWRDAIKHYYRANDITGSTWLIMNLPLFESLPQEDQKILEEVAEEYVPWAWNLFLVGSEEKLDALRAEGVEVIYLTDEQTRAFAEISRDVEWTGLEATVGKEIIDTFRELAPPIP